MKKFLTTTLVLAAATATTACGTTTAPSTYETPGEISQQLHDEGIHHTLEIDDHDIINPILRFDSDDGMHFIWLESDGWNIDDFIDTLDSGVTVTHGEDWLIDFSDGTDSGVVHDVSDALGGDVVVG